MVGHWEKTEPDRKRHVEPERVIGKGCGCTYSGLESVIIPSRRGKQARGASFLIRSMH